MIGHPRSQLGKQDQMVMQHVLPTKPPRTFTFVSGQWMSRPEVQSSQNRYSTKPPPGLRVPQVDSPIHAAAHLISFIVH